MAKSKAAVHEIWQRVLADDPTAWEQLVSQYQALVYTVAIRCGLSAADAADCFQQTWLSLYKSRRQIKDSAKLISWLITTTRRDAVRLRRKANNFSPLDDDCDSESLAPGPDAEMEAFERQLLLRAALEQLNNRDRLLIEEMFFAAEPKNYDEIAATLNVPVNNLGPMRHRCLSKLRKILEAMEVPKVRNREWLPLLIEELQAGKEQSVAALEPPGY